MNEAEGLRQRRPLRPQVITEDSPAQEAKEGRWGWEGVGGKNGGKAGPEPGWELPPPAPLSPGLLRGVRAGLGSLASDGLRGG